MTRSKNINYSFLSFFVLHMFLSSCDQVKNANESIVPAAPIENTKLVYRKSFLEKYTGHKCGNCPAASEVANLLQNQYLDKIISLDIHAGFFATTNATYPTEFRTIAGTAYDNEFGISAAGNPNGLINRINYGSGSFIKSPSSWGGEISQIVNQLAKFEIKIENDFNTITSNLTTSIMVKSLANNNGNYKLVVLLSEDSIVAEQLDYRLPSGSQLVNNYVFRHVLRDAINSEWGDPVFLTTANINDSVVKLFSNYNVNLSYNSNKCYIIAYVYDANPLSGNYYEVLQVEEKKIR